ncbi:uncharacterized protein Aud_003753 [Aspergillus udagawae]|uniref:Uncharacterized protein n=1 Tax=Aspergillus udagawae TaxID=91492 RepID=A0A8E0QM25_9EURO|nr:uncharacterized protein Aud_003753 [Aspergillus udagawae]GFG02449.1 hypothetical protein IFM5058_00941 [Aspergillus udagawae]GIC87369.1 hypothetical protein Aud_003753 [Aspergillus udagawae]
MRVSIISILSLLITSGLAMATTRYTVPIPEGIPVLETRKQLNDMADQYPMGTVDDRNGGYYLLDHDGTVLAVTSDSLCEELDASMESARKFHADNLDDEADVAPRGDNAAASCSHPRCHTHALCRTYSDCHVCSSSYHWCF